MKPHSVYIHIPFCQKRCSYCDFNTFAGRESIIPAYINALQKEIEFLGSRIKEAFPVHTIYFGGGTPSLLSPDQFSKILTTLKNIFILGKTTEITLEANPGTVTLPNLRELSAIGFNRLSLGMQSSRPRELVLLGRQHDFLDVINTVGWARQAGFNNLSIDLIFGIPGQTVEDWEETLRGAIDLSPDHFSLYGLTIEPDTMIHNWYIKGLIPPQNPDLGASMYELADNLLEDSGYQNYEISNWAKRNIDQIPNDVGEIKSIPKIQSTEQQCSEFPDLQFSCLHNLQYWRNLPYLGFGAGAHGFANGYRTVNVLDPQDFILATEIISEMNGKTFPQGLATSEITLIDRETEIQEYMIMGLRLTVEGVSDIAFQARFGNSIREQFGNKIQKIIDWGLLEWEDGCLRLTSRGRLLGNRVFLEFM
jgi:oxygen-independent coproporphyrinogen-3 oxidase